MKSVLLSFSAIVLGLLISCSPTKSPQSNISQAETAGVIGGRIASSTEFPYLVNLVYNNRDENYEGHLCGGTLVHPQWVVTAAHCVLNDTTDVKAGFIDVRKLILIVDTNQRDGLGGTSYQAKSIHIHPDFAWPKYDIALVQVAQEINGLEIAEVNTEAIHDFSSPILALAAGWGMTDELGIRPGSSLQQIELPLISRDECAADPMVQEKKWSIGTETLCTSTTQNKKATCAGDSGGPLILQKNGKNLLIGVISWGWACRPHFREKKSNIEGYADVSAASKWILEMIQK